MKNPVRAGHEWERALEMLQEAWHGPARGYAILDPQSLLHVIGSPVRDIGSAHPTLSDGWRA